MRRLCMRAPARRGRKAPGREESGPGGKIDDVRQRQDHEAGCRAGAL